MSTEFKLPELEENVQSGTVLKLHVSKGDRLEKGQTVLEMETDKAVFELPVDVAGRVREINVAEGDDVAVGQTILLIDEDDGSAEAAGKGEPRSATPEASAGEMPSGAFSDREAEVDTAKSARISEPGEKRFRPPRSPAQPGSAEPISVILPEVGENVESGVVIKVLVAVGDHIESDQGIVELETDKAVFEVPAPADGVVKKILVNEGDEVSVGQEIAVLVGGEPSPAEAADKEPSEPTGMPADEHAAVTAATPVPEPESRETATASSQVSEPSPRRAQDVAPAAPSVRRFAREIGLDINDVPGSGPGGRISIDDVKTYSRLLNRQRASAQAVFRGIEPESLPDFSRWGDIERKSMSGIRLKTAQHLGYAWATVAHVTQHDLADITDVDAFRRRFTSRVEARGGKLTLTVILLKVIAAALRQFPNFNASIDLPNEEIVFKKYCHIGVAVDTDHGLLVPVIRDVDRKSITRLAVEMGEVSDRARKRKLSLEEMQGGCFTISNLGGIGGTAFSPIVHTPEVAILGVSRARMEPVFQDGAFVPRLMMPLSLSYDHRLIDGADAARFLRWVVEALEQPFLLALE